MLPEKGDLSDLFDMMAGLPRVDILSLIFSHASHIRSAAFILPGRTISVQQKQLFPVRQHSTAQC
jgi:hypothetical protein